MNIKTKFSGLKDALRVFLVMCWKWLVKKYKYGFIVWNKNELVYCERGDGEWDHNCWEKYFVVHIKPSIIRFSKWAYDGLPIVEFDFIFIRFTYSVGHFWHCCETKHKNYEDVIRCKNEN